MSIGSEALASLPLSGVGGDVYVGDVTVRPNGWAAATFGQAKIVYAQKGWCVSTIPSPRAAHNTINVSAGWATRAFGTPSAIAATTFRATSLGKISVFGTPAEHSHVTCLVGEGGRAVFGTPRSRVAFRAEMIGAAMVSFGRVDAVIRSKPVGWKVPLFGQIGVSRAQMAHGFVVTRMGHPRMNRTAPFNPILSLPTMYVSYRQHKISVLT